MALICLLLCLFGVKALAELQPAAKERIRPGLPPGMAATWKVSPGAIDILIDAQKTDWDMVAAAATKSGSLVIHPGMDAPEGSRGEVAVRDYYLGRETNALAELVKKATEDQGGDSSMYSCSYQGWAIGRYDEVTGLFTPQGIPPADGAGTAFCWRMGTNSYQYERVRITVNFTSMEPIYVRRQAVPADDIRLNVQTGISNLAGASHVSGEKEDGSVVYHIANSEVGKQVVTVVAVPEHLENQTIQAYFLSNGKDTGLTIAAAGTYISGRRSVTLPYELGNRENNMYKKDWGICWTDSDGKLLYVSRLEAVFLVGNPDKPTVAYETNPATPVPKENLMLTYSNPLDGLDASYQNGVLKLSVDAKKLPANRKAELDLPSVSALVKAPEGAKSCKIYLFRGDIIYGNCGENAEWLGWGDIGPDGMVAVRELTDRRFFKEFPIELHNGKMVSYYFSELMVGRYGGETVVFEWYGPEGTGRISKQYVSIQSEANRYSVEKNPSLTKNPNKAVDLPAVQTTTPMFVEAAELPQSGDDAIRYEITLFDHNGIKTQPTEPVLLYLPYPDGKTQAECENMAFAVYHQGEVYSTQNGKLACTPYGLCLEVTSFSPYDLTWENVPASLPTTGDRSNLTLYMALLALCIAAAAMKARKTAE